MKITEKKILSFIIIGCLTVLLFSSSLFYSSLFSGLTLTTNSAKSESVPLWSVLAEYNSEIIQQAAAQVREYEGRADCDKDEEWDEFEQRCVPIKECDEDEEWDHFNEQCVPIKCQDWEEWDWNARRCVPIECHVKGFIVWPNKRCVPESCDDPLKRDETTGDCI